MFHIVIFYVDENDNEFLLESLDLWESPQVGELIFLDVAGNADWHKSAFVAMLRVERRGWQITTTRVGKVEDGLINVLQEALLYVRPVNDRDRTTIEKILAEEGRTKEK